jgi:hypothetical protein
LGTAHTKCQNTWWSVSYWNHPMPEHFVISHLLRSFNAKALRDHSAIKVTQCYNTSWSVIHRVNQCQNTSWLVSYWSHSLPEHFIISQLLKSPNARALRDQSPTEVIQCQSTSWSFSY